jgi:hypothetical protein
MSWSTLPLGKYQHDAAASDYQHDAAASDYQHDAAASDYQHDAAASDYQHDAAVLMLRFSIAASDFWPPLPERIRGFERALFWERAGVRANANTQSFDWASPLTHGLRVILRSVIASNWTLRFSIIRFTAPPYRNPVMNCSTTIGRGSNPD